MALHIPKRPRSRKTSTVPVSFCVSWGRIFFVLVLFYMILALCIYLQIVGNLSPRGTPTQSSGGAMHEMLRSIRNDTSAERIASILGRAVEEVEQEIAFVEHEAEKFLPMLAIPPQHVNPVARSPVEKDYSQRLHSFATKLNEGRGEHDQKLRSCRWRDKDEAGFYSIDDSCPSERGPITYFNPLKEARIVCNHNIAAGATLVLQEPCHEPSRLFRHIPDLTGLELPVVTTGFESGGPANDFDCNIPCRNRGSPGIVCQRYVDGTDWVFEFSMEGPQYYPNLEIKADAYRTNHFYSTTSYKSEVPLPYYSWAEYNIHVPGLNYDDAIKAAVFLARNCNSRNNREDIIRKLQQSSFRVDSLSACLHNAEPPPGVSLGDKKAVMGHYLFYLAFENQNEPDYITEKLWGPFEAGTVPVYFGAPNIKEHVPNNSIIAVDDFATIDDLANHLTKVANDKELYQSYQAWRYQPLPPHFHAKYDFTNIHSTCRTCRWAHARLYGLGWNHYNQSLQELRMPRTLCVGKDGLVEKPFIEHWAARDGGAVDVLARSKSVFSSCQVGNESRTLNVGSSLTRTLWEKDGIIDVEIRGELPEGAAFVFHIQVPLLLPELIHVASGHLRLQTNETRYTVLTLPRILDSNDFESIHVSDNNGHNVYSHHMLVDARVIPLKVRIIVEDVDTLHQGGGEVENYFGERMIQDFYNPLEAFVST